MDWDDLRYVLAISRGRSLSQAAATLGVSHTTVGRRITAIEQALGVRLFDRTPDAFVPTPAGQDIADVAEQMEREVLAVESRVLGRDVQLDGKLRVATMDMLFRACSEAFSSFKVRYPSVQLTVTSSDTEVSLLRREADVALRMTNTPPEYLVGRKVGRIEFAVYAARSLVARVGENARYEDFPWLHWDERLNMKWLDEWLAKHAPGAKIVMRMDFGSRLIHETVAAGIGVHFLACVQGDSDPTLKRIGDVQTAYARDLWLLTLPELKSTPRVRAFMDHLDAWLRERRAMLAGTPGTQP